MISVYYAHPESDFGTKYEREVASMAARRIEAMFRQKVRVVSPSAPKHRQGIAERGPEYFYNQILPRCDQCVADAMPNGELPFVVAKEIEAFQSAGKQTWVVRSAPVFMSRVTWVPAFASPPRSKDLLNEFSAMPNGGRITGD